MSDNNEALSLALIILDDIAPEEVPVLEALGPDLARSDALISSSDGALGFGVEEFAWSVVALPVSKAVVSFLVDQAKEAVSDSIKEQTKELLERWKARGAHDTKAVANLSIPSEMPEQVRDVAYRHGITIGLLPEQAALLADAVQNASAKTRDANADISTSKGNFSAVRPPHCHNICISNGDRRTCQSL
jgi:hypothetical protein